ncbi:MAG: hypothetical protein QOK36_2366 [Gaiellales bacterium]|nr:hypothetical protein [Gaiellales bacterium]
MLNPAATQSRLETQRGRATDAERHRRGAPERATRRPPSRGSKRSEGAPPTRSATHAEHPSAQPKAPATQARRPLLLASVSGALRAPRQCL